MYHCSEMCYSEKDNSSQNVYHTAYQYVFTVRHNLDFKFRRIDDLDMHVGITYVKWQASSTFNLFAKSDTTYVTIPTHYSVPLPSNQALFYLNTIKD